MKVHRILIVDDHPLTRAGTISVLREALPGASFGEASTLAQVLAAVDSELWDLVMLDQNLPDGLGLDILPHLAKRASVVVLSMYQSRELCVQALRAGARGYLSKAEPPASIAGGVLRVLAGKDHFPILDADRASENKSLSEREAAVLKELLRGRRMVDIARDLSLSPNTVQSYKNRLLVKFQADSMADLLREAMARGMS